MSKLPLVDMVGAGSPLYQLTPVSRFILSQLPCFLFLKHKKTCFTPTNRWQEAESCHHPVGGSPEPLPTYMPKPHREKRPGDFSRELQVMISHNPP